MWRVGNGKSIKVLKDLWILGLNVKQLLEQTHVEEWDLTMDSLIDDSTQWWTVERVRALFNPNIAAEILKIRVCPNSNDKWYWS